MTLISLDPTLNTKVSQMIAKLSDAYADLESAVDDYINTMESAWEGVSNAMDEYNTLIRKANELTYDVHRSINSLESDENSASIGAWADEWNIDFEEIDLEQPPSPSLEYIDDVSQALANLPTESD